MVLNRVKRTNITASLLMLVSAAALFAWLAQQADTRQFDSAIRRAVHQVSSPALTEIMRAVSVLGEVVALIALSVAVIALLCCFRRFRDAVLLGITMLGALGLDLGLKGVFHRSRPVPFFGAAPNSYSFPSGHALASLCFFATFALILSGYVQPRGVRWLIWIAAVLLIAVIGFSRIYLGVHYPSDVVGGYCAGIFWVGMVRRFRK